MEKQEVIVDTCFLEKIALDGECPENIKRVLNELAYKPVINEYIAKQELSLIGYLDNLVQTGYIRVVEYSEYISDDVDKVIYEQYFIQLYDEIRTYLKAKGGRKQMPELVLKKGESIYDKHLVGSNMGDVHMILMALYMGLPVVLTEDSDISLLRDMAQRRFATSKYQLEIYDIVDLMKKVAEKTNCIITHSELKSILKKTGKKGSWPEVNEIWRLNHDNEA